jgi:hypothetical protein
MIPNASKTGRAPVPQSYPAAATRPSAGAATTRESAIPSSAQDSAQRRKIAECAYFIAEKRNFSGGDPVGDWLTAEQQVGGANR